jgi:CheY-like chemotaxis protein
MSIKTERKRIVCIVDDNDDIRDIYSIKFRREGFLVVIARDGEEALLVIQKEHPNVILLDLQMPIMDGVAVLKALKSDPDFAKIPVVVLSNVDKDEMFQEISELGGARYYLIKSLTDPQKVVDVTLEALADH